MKFSQKQKHIGVIAALAASTAALSGCSYDRGVNSASEEQTPSAQQELATIMQWWNGDYNNDRQLAQLIAEGKPIWRADDSGEGGHIEVTSHYRPVTLPAFGENVIYVEETKHGDPNNMFRQRIYSLSVDEAGEMVRVKLWYFNDKEKYVGAWKDLSRLNELTPEDMFALPDSCDLLVKKEDDKYHMPMADKACVFGKNYFSYQVLLGPDSFWFRDKINAVADDSVVSMAGEFTNHELDKLGASSSSK
jgi:hypothetical protein